MAMIEFLRQRYTAQPFEVSIETLALCNAACGFCPYPTLERRGARLGTDTIDGLITQMKSWREPFFISPFKVNEPLLDTRLPDICQRIERDIAQARLRLFTNGSALTEHHLKWIGALTRLDHLWISLNASEPQEHQEAMRLARSGAFERIAARLDALHARGFPHAVVLSKVAAREDTDVRFTEFVKRRWPCFTPIVIKRDGWLGYVEPSSQSVPQAPCGRWFEMSITATAQAVLCCMDGKGEYVLGDVRSESLLDIYNRPLLRRRRVSALTRAGIEPCARCTY